MTHKEEEQPVEQQQQGLVDVHERKRARDEQDPEGDRPRITEDEPSLEHVEETVGPVLLEEDDLEDESASKELRVQDPQSAPAASSSEELRATEASVSPSTSGQSDQLQPFFDVASWTMEIQVPLLLFTLFFSFFFGFSEK